MKDSDISIICKPKKFDLWKRNKKVQRAKIVIENFKYIRIKKNTSQKYDLIKSGRIVVSGNLGVDYKKNRYIGSSRRKGAW